MRASVCRAARDAAYVMPALALLGFLYIYPIGYGFYLSTNRAAHGAWWSNYTQALLHDPTFHRALVNTVLFTAAAVVFQTGLGFLLAVLLASVRRCGAITERLFSLRSCCQRSPLGRYGSTCSAPILARSHRSLPGSD